MLDSIINLLRTTFGKLIGIAVLIAVYFAANALFYGAQELYHYEDKKELDAIKQELMQRETRLNKSKSQIVSLGNDLEAYQSKMDYWKSAHMVYEYNSNLPVYNQMVNDYNSKIASYKNNCEIYNQKVEAYNALAKSSGKRWRLIPLPRGVKHL